MSFSYPRIWVPYTIVASVNDQIEIGITNGINAGAHTITMTPGEYLTPELLLAEVVSEIAADAGGETVTATLSATTGKVTFACANSMKFTATPGSRDIREALGMDPTSNDTATSFVADYQMQNLWNPGEVPRFDSEDYPTSDEGLTVTLDGHHQGVEHGERTERRVILEWLDESKVITAREGTAVNEAFQRIWSACKARFRYWPDRSSLGTYDDYFLIEPRKTWNPERMRPKPAVYRVEFLFGAYES